MLNCSVNYFWHCVFVNLLVNFFLLIQVHANIYALIYHYDSRNNVIACAKHFVGDGGTDKGKNEGDTILSYEDLERVHMAPYPDCIAQGVCTIMASYSSWNGRKLHSDHFLLTQVLKEKLGFKVKLIDSFISLNPNRTKLLEFPICFEGIYFCLA